MSVGRTRHRIFSIVVVVVAAAVVGLLLARRDTSDRASASSDGVSAEASAEGRATVERRDLVDTVDVDGVVGYGAPRTVRGTGTGTGTVTALPEAGVVIEVDQPLYHVDGRPGPIVLTGEIPLWRVLEVGVDDGADVAQLEAALTALGYADPDMTVDDEFTSLTADAVEAWQEAHGLEETGRIELGSVWYSPGPVRIASTVAEVGDLAQGDILTTTDDDRVVQLDVEVRDSLKVDEGDAVELELADGTGGTGVVSHVAGAATVTSGEGQAEETVTVAVEVTPDGDLDAPDQSPVTVSFVRDTVEDALTVPLEAVVATSGGGFALELIDHGTTQLVDVELGRLADGWIQVTGEIEAGQTVVTP